MCWRVQTIPAALLTQQLFEFYKCLRCIQTLNLCFLAARVDRRTQSVLHVVISSTASVVTIGEYHPWGLKECGKRDFSSSSSFPELQTRILNEKGSRRTQWPEICLYSRL